MADYFLMQILYYSSSPVRPISDIFVSIGCSSTLLKHLYCQFSIIILDFVSGKKINCCVPAVSELFRVSDYTGGLYIALKKYDNFK